MVWSHVPSMAIVAGDSIMPLMILVVDFAYALGLPLRVQGHNTCERIESSAQGEPSSNVYGFAKSRKT